MRTVGRITITVVAALLLGVLSYVEASDLDRSGTLGSLVYSPVLDWAPFVLLIVAIAVVNRWWALSISLAPLAVLFYLHEATDYVYPFHEDPYPAITIIGTFLLLCIASLGLVLRRLAQLLAARLG